MTMGNLLDLFELGMKRKVNPFYIDWYSCLNLGPGESHIPDTMELDLPEWDAELEQPMPFDDETVGTVLGFHFLEHLTLRACLFVLRETERVLKPNGTAIFMVPHASQTMAFQDLDHKTFWTEDTMRNLMNNPYYAKMRLQPWRLKVESSFIMAVAVRNLAVFFQLRKEA